jgi:hypothetical protein
LGLAGEDKEGCLEGVLGIMRIADDALANPQDHWAMALNDSGERRLVALSDESMQQQVICRIP